jgi:hypothetical protein
MDIQPVTSTGTTAAIALASSGFTGICATGRTSHNLFILKSEAPVGINANTGIKRKMQNLESIKHHLVFSIFVQPFTVQSGTKPGKMEKYTA